MCIHALYSLTSRKPLNMQILGNLYPHYPNKAQKAVQHFKDAASRSDKDPEIWEMLGELLAPSDPSGGCSADLVRPCHAKPCALPLLSGRQV